MTILKLFGKHWGLQSCVMRALNNKNALAEVSQIFENTVLQKKAPKTQASVSKSCQFLLDPSKSHSIPCEMEPNLFI